MQWTSAEYTCVCVCKYFVMKKLQEVRVADITFLINGTPFADAALSSPIFINLFVLMWPQLCRIHIHIPIVRPYTPLYIYSILLLSLIYESVQVYDSNSRNLTHFLECGSCCSALGMTHIDFASEFITILRPRCCGNITVYPRAHWIIE